MKRSTIIVLLLVFVASFSVAGVDFEFEQAAENDQKHWNNLPDRWKFSLITESRAETEYTMESEDERSLKIRGFFYTEKVTRRYFGDDWSKNKEAVLKNIDSLQSKWCLIPLRLFIQARNAPITLDNPDIYGFDPAEDTYFSQGGERILTYRYPSIIGVQSLDKYFFEGDFFTYSTADGFLAIPKEVELDEPFKLHFQKYPGTVELIASDIGVNEEQWEDCYFPD